MAVEKFVGLMTGLYVSEISDSGFFLKTEFDKYIIAIILKIMIMTIKARIMKYG
ncbi:MAG: hypothetical protein AABW90_02190 [Nanoarchaeota archaeon]